MVDFYYNMNNRGENMLMSLFSSVSFLAVMIYLIVGIYAFMQNKESNLHKAFLALCSSYAFWAFAYAFAYLAKDRYVFSFWNKISAVGWCSFSAISLFFVLNLIEAKILKNKLFIAALFSPAVFFFVLAVFFFGPSVNTPILIEKIFDIGDFTYNFTYLILSMIVLWVYGHKSESRRVKLQAIILINCSVIPFFLNLLTQTLMPMLGFKEVPLMGQIYALITVIGAYIVISRYKFLKLPEKFISEEIMREMMDMTIIINEKGNIVRVNKHTLSLAGYTEAEIVNKPIETIINLPIIRENCVGKKWKNKIRFNDAKLITKKSREIPINVSCVPVYGQYIGEFICVILILQDIRIINRLKEKNKMLEDKSYRDGLTNLFNHQHSIELLEKEINKNKVISIIMLDIDYFKKVNDTYGHQFGDEVLVSVSQMISEVIGKLGYVGRYGGEEFIVILPKTGIEKSRILAEEVRASIKEHRFNNDCFVTMSCGVKQWENEDLMELIKNADKLLYKAKENGRDRVESN